jgi:hypothetical protein
MRTLNCANSWRTHSGRLPISGENCSDPKAEKLTAEQEQQIKAVKQDLRDAVQRLAPVSAQVLEREDRAERRRRQHRHPSPDHLETITVTIEPEEKVCPCCGKFLQKVSEEVSEKIDMIPPKLDDGARFVRSLVAVAAKPVSK